MIGLSQEQIKDVLQKAKTVAVVGLSKEPLKESNKVSVYLQKHGYRVIPVNPFVDEVLGEKSYKSLLDIPIEIQKTLDVIDIFRRAEDVPQIMDQAIQIKTKLGKPLVVWMQLGIVNTQAVETAQRTGLVVVMDKCLMVEHHRLQM
jgi:predicted CoA-binding protein